MTIGADGPGRGAVVSGGGALQAARGGEGSTSGDGVDGQLELERTTRASEQANLLVHCYPCMTCHSVCMNEPATATVTGTGSARHTAAQRRIANMMIMMIIR